MTDRDELLRAALSDGAPDGVDRAGLIAWYEQRADRYGEQAANDAPDSEARELQVNARARARAIRRGRDW